MTAHVQPVSLVGATVADKYRLLRVLGIGGMGVVYEAQHSVTHRRVALKMLHSWVLESSPQAAARFVREAQASASIEHPAIVDVLDAGQLPDGALYLVFEMLDGVDLENAIAGGQVFAQDIVAIAVDVLEGLSAAHARGFVHRDIKPANVFLSKDHAGDRHVKLLDFGIAKRLDPSSTFTGITAHGSIVGTLEYMSPEQASAQVVDGRTDIWALGALLFRALAGRAPFLGATQLETVKAILCAPVPSLAEARPDLPYSLTSIVDRALTRDREQRWPTAIAMREALLAIDRAVLPPELPRPTEHSGLTPEVPDREAETPEDQPFQDFTANEPTRRAPMPPTEISVMREEPTQISRERDVVTVRVRDPDFEPQVLVIGIDPLSEERPAIDNPIDNPITKIVLDQSLLGDSMLRRRSSGGRWTFVALMLLTAIAAGAWVMFADRSSIAESDPRTELVQAIEPAIEPPQPVKAIAEPEPRPVQLKEEPREQKKEKKRVRTKRSSKRVEKAAPAAIEVKEAAPEPPQKKSDEEFFYKEDHL